METHPQNEPQFPTLATLQLAATNLASILSPEKQDAARLLGETPRTTQKRRNDFNLLWTDAPASMVRVHPAPLWFVGCIQRALTATRADLPVRLPPDLLRAMAHEAGYALIPLELAHQFNCHTFGEPAAPASGFTLIQVNHPPQNR